MVVLSSKNVNTLDVLVGVEQSSFIESFIERCPLFRTYWIALCLGVSGRFISTHCYRVVTRLAVCSDTTGHVISLTSHVTHCICEIWGPVSPVSSSLERTTRLARSSCTDLAEGWRERELRCVTANLAIFGPPSCPNVQIIFYMYAKTPMVANCMKSVWGHIPGGYPHTLMLHA